MARSSRVAVVVLNWRNEEDTLECLASLRASTTKLHIIVVDNASDDGSAEAIEDSGLADVVIRNARNDGYAGGNNRGLRAALDEGYPFVAVLNNDTIVEPGTFTRLLGTAEQCVEPTALSPRILYASPVGVPWFAGGVVDRGLPRHLQPDEAPPAHGLTASETLTGCCILASADVWTSVGLFDEDYFLIFEDSDWSARAASRSVRLLVDQESVLVHKVSRSFSGDSMSLLGAYFYIRNGLRYHARHQPRHLPRFAADHVARPLLRRARSSTGSRRVRLWAVAGWLVGHRGNAPERLWRFASAIAQDGSRRTAGAQGG